MSNSSNYQLEPLHTMHTTYYLVNRPLLWFSAGSKIPAVKMQEYFTNKAIQSLLQFEFITYLHKGN